MASIDFTTKTDVKAMLAWTGTDEDTVIDDLIHQVSREAEEYLGRWAHVEARTEIYTLRRNQSWLSLRGFPITSVASIKYGQTEDFTSVTALDTSLYSVRSNLGQIRFRLAACSFIWDPGFVEVQYTGGLAVDVATLKTNEPRLEGAVRTEVINRFNRRKNPEGNVQSFGSGVAFQGAMKPLEDFYGALDHRRRLRL